MSFIAPFVDIRIETPDISVSELYEMPGLVAIQLHPPASGPEVELIFATEEGGEPLEEEHLREEVERVTGKQALASRRREMT